MQAHFKDRLHHLRSQAKRRTIHRRNIKAQLRRKDERIAQLERQAEETRRKYGPTRLHKHRYPVKMIQLAIFIVVIGGGSLRCAAATVEFYAQLMGWSFSRPSPTTIRDWVMRSGIYALTKRKQLSGDYAVIIDESIQIGKEKLLLLLGVKLEADFCHCAPLTSADVEVLGMEVQSSWTGELIASFIKRNLAQCGSLKLAYLLSDQGSAILAAVRMLNLNWVSDCSHVMMNAVKRIFGKDKELSELCAQIGGLRHQFLLTEWGPILPPTLRSKDRFLRIFTLVPWMERMDSYWSRLPPKVRRQIGFYQRAWLRRRLTQVHQLVVLTAEILKRRGLSLSSQHQWQVRVGECLGGQQLVTAQARSFVTIMQAYFKAHTAQYDSARALLCCSDIMEATFGRYKNKGGMKAISGDVLSLALYNRELTASFISKAMKQVSCQAVRDWECDNVCHNRYGLRRRIDKELKTVT